MSHRPLPPSRRTLIRATIGLLGMASLGYAQLGMAATEATTENNTTKASKTSKAGKATEATETTKATETNVVTVWKTPTCGCCKDWVIHLRKEGFNVVTNDVTDTAPVRQKLGLPAKFGSCHTAQIGGYVLEGHVPARDVKRLLREKPVAIGLAVPGMPVGSPGMEMTGEMLGVRDAFNVVLVTHDGSSRVYESYAAKAATKTRVKS